MSALSEAFIKATLAKFEEASVVFQVQGIYTLDEELVRMAMYGNARVNDKDCMEVLDGSVKTSKAAAIELGLIEEDGDMRDEIAQVILNHHFGKNQM